MGWGSTGNGAQVDPLRCRCDTNGTPRCEVPLDNPLCRRVSRSVADMGVGGER